MIAGGACDKSKAKLAVRSRNRHLQLTFEDDVFFDIHPFAGARAMPAKTVDLSLEAAANAAADAVAESERSLAELARRAEKAMQEGLAELRERSRDYADVAGEQFETAQRYVVDRVQERPVAATLAALGVGLVLGLLLAGRNK